MAYGDRPTFDARDAEILAKKVAEWNNVSGPRVGDYVILTNGIYDRFTYDMGEGIQVGGGVNHEYSRDYKTRHWKEHKDGGYGFYLSHGGCVSYSGSLDRSVPKSHLELTGETRDGGFWFFHHDRAEAHNGVCFTVPCRVWRLHETEFKGRNMEDGGIYRIIP
jgi:hypothetical protein